MTPPRTGRPSMADVGERAGVSRETVSRVLNSKSYVSVETRKRVEEAIRDLNFRPNRTARSLAMRRTESVGVITIGPAHALLAIILHGIANAATAVGYSVTVNNLEFDPDQSDIEEKVSAAFERYMSEGVEGLIIVSAYSGVLAPVVQRAKELPIVLVFGQPTPGVGTATIDSYRGGYIAGKHLLALGHRHIAHLAGPVERFDSEDREKGFRAALSDAGVELELLLRGDWSSESGYEQGRALRERRDITGIFAGNDEMAIGVMHAMNEVSRFAPADYSIIGYDDNPVSAHVYPPLSTVKQDFTTIGERSFAELLEAIRTGTFVHVSLDPTLVKRDSTRAI